MQNCDLIWSLYFYVKATKFLQDLDYEPINSLWNGTQICSTAVRMQTNGKPGIEASPEATYISMKLLVICILWYKRHWIFYIDTFIIETGIAQILNTHSLKWNSEIDTGTISLCHEALLLNRTWPTLCLQINWYFTYLTRPRVTHIFSTALLSNF